MDEGTTVSVIGVYREGGAMPNEELSAIVKLRAMIQHAAQRLIENGKEATTTLVLPKGVRLFGNRGPVGELLCVNSAGESVVKFKAAAIARACEKALKELDPAH